MISTSYILLQYTISSQQLARHQLWAPPVPSKLVSGQGAETSNRSQTDETGSSYLFSDNHHTMTQFATWCKLKKGLWKLCILWCRFSQQVAYKNSTWWIKISVQRFFIAATQKFFLATKARDASFRVILRVTRYFAWRVISRDAFILATRWFSWPVHTLDDIIVLAIVDIPVILGPYYV